MKHTRLSLQPIFKSFFGLNRGSVNDPRIMWEAVKGFIPVRSNTNLYASNWNKERKAKVEALECKYTTLDATLQYNDSDCVSLQKELVKRENNSLLRCHSEFLMHRTRQTYYFHSSKPSHLLATRLRTNEHFADIFCFKSKDGTVLSDP